MIATFTSREFNQDLASAKKAALKGPVFVTDRGKPAHVLLNIDDYLSLAKQNSSIVEALAMDTDASIEFEPKKLEVSFKPADFS